MALWNWIFWSSGLGAVVLCVFFFVLGAVLGAVNFVSVFLCAKQKATWVLLFYLRSCLSGLCACAVLYSLTSFRFSDTDGFQLPHCGKYTH